MPRVWQGGGTPPPVCTERLSSRYPKAERQLRPTRKKMDKKSPGLLRALMKTNQTYLRRRNNNRDWPPGPANANYNMTSTAGCEIRRSKVASFI